jgi:hypothetical protein
VDDKTDIQGNLPAAQKVRIRGRVEGNDVILAEEIDVLCAQGGSRAEDNGEKNHDPRQGDEGDKENED